MRGIFKADLKAIFFPEAAILLLVPMPVPMDKGKLWE